MKKLILLLLFIPLVSFGQDWNFDSQSSEWMVGKTKNKMRSYSSKDGRKMHIYYWEKPVKDQLKENEATGNYEWTTKNISGKSIEYYQQYNNSLNAEDWKKVEEYVEGIKTSEINYKGNCWRDGFQKKTWDSAYDGFTRIYSGNLICSEQFYIYHNLIYISDAKCMNNLIPRDYNTVEEYDLEAMVNIFLDDYLNNYLDAGLPNGEKASIPSFFEDFKNMFNIKATFVPLEGDALALAYGFKDDKNIVLKVDPEKWAKASSAKRWYTLYHELGHDVLNFEHGQGGKMMFNFADRDYNWKTFEKDRNYMFKKAIENAKGVVVWLPYLSF